MHSVWGGYKLCMFKDFIGLCIIVLYVGVIIPIKDPEDWKVIVVSGNINGSFADIYFIYVK